MINFIFSPLLHEYSISFQDPKKIQSILESDDKMKEVLSQLSHLQYDRIHLLDKNPSRNIYVIFICMQLTLFYRSQFRSSIVDRYYPHELEEALSYPWKQTDTFYLGKPNAFLYINNRLKIRYDPTYLLIQLSLSLEIYDDHNMSVLSQYPKTDYGISFLPLELKDIVTLWYYNHIFSTKSSDVSNILPRFELLYPALSLLVETPFGRCVLQYCYDCIVMIGTDVEQASPLLRTQMKQRFHLFKTQCKEIDVSFTKTFFKKERFCLFTEAMPLPRWSAGCVLFAYLSHFLYFFPKEGNIYHLNPRGLKRIKTITDIYHQNCETNFETILDYDPIRKMNVPKRVYFQFFPKPAIRRICQVDLKKPNYHTFLETLAPKLHCHYSFEKY